MAPRLVLVTRTTEYESILANYSTAGAATYALSTAESITSSADPAVAVASASVAATELASGGSVATLNNAKQRVARAATARSLNRNANSLKSYQASYSDYRTAKSIILQKLPEGWRRATVDRKELDGFIFEPDDVVVCLGQDGLVANVAKYLVDNQPVIGMSYTPSGYLIQWLPEELSVALDMAQKTMVDERTMVQATLDNGQTIYALNEIYVGHQGHQSSKYTLFYGAQRERQSSSGLICFTGTGATGWAKSCFDTYVNKPTKIDPWDDGLSFFVREPWPSTTLGFSDRIRCGSVGKHFGVAGLTVQSEIESGGVVFGDGVESDSLSFNYGRLLALTVAEHHLALVVNDARAIVELEDETFAAAAPAYAGPVPAIGFMGGTGGSGVTTAATSMRYPEDTGTYRKKNFLRRNKKKG